MRSPLFSLMRSEGFPTSTPRNCRIEQLEERLLLTVSPVAPLDLGGDARVDPDDFRVTAFASGLNYPVSMQQLSDGSLLVGTANPLAPAAGFFGATVELVRLVDSNHDGVADGPGQVVFSGLPGATTAVREAGDLLFVASTNFSGPERRISVLRSGAAPGDPYTLIGHIEFAPRAGSIHETKTLAVRDTPGQPGSYDLVFGVGAITNDTATVDPVDVSGLINASINSDSIYLVTVDNTGPQPVFSNLTQLATGVRNTAGIIFHPTTGDLYFADNNFNDPNSPGEPISTDEMNTIAAGDLGGAIEDFGFPENYIEYRTGDEIGSGAIDPIAVFQPVSTNPVEESEGPSEIAFAPADFPEGLNNGVFVTFHGESPAGALNRENPVVYLDRETGEYFHFISVDSAGVGHIDGILSTQDSLFLADISSNGELTNASGMGVIYQVMALPEVEASTVGLYDPQLGTFYLKSENTSGHAEVIFGFGPDDMGWSPLSGDWDGDGDRTVGLFDPDNNFFWLQNVHQTGGAEVGFRFGPRNADWLPVVGDWDHDDDDSVGMYDPVAGKFFLNYGNGAGSADLTYRFGPRMNDWLPIAGDWNGDGVDTIGLYDPETGTFYLRTEHASGAADMKFRYGPKGAGWTPLSGDWNRDGIDTVGLYNPVTSTYYLTDTHTPGPADTMVGYGPAGQGWLPLMGNWGLTVSIQPTAASSEGSTESLSNPFTQTGTGSFGLLSASVSVGLHPVAMANPNDPLSGSHSMPDTDPPGDASTYAIEQGVIGSASDDSNATDPVLEIALTELIDELLI